MVYKVDGNPQLDSSDWSMYSNILNPIQTGGTFSLQVYFLALLKRFAVG